MMNGRKGEMRLVGDGGRNEMMGLAVMSIQGAGRAVK